MSNHNRSARLAPRLISRKQKLAVNIMASLSLMVLSAGVAQAAAPHAGESSMPGTSSNGLLATPVALVAGNTAVDTTGELYGIATGGGTSGLGGIFSETASQFFTNLQSTNTLQVNSDATITSQGELNAQQIVQSSTGPLYFVNYGGGTAGPNSATAHGAVYEYTSANGVVALHTFYGAATSDGANPFTIALGTNGNLYGATAGYVAGSNSAIFQLTPQGAETILYTANDSRAPDNFLIGTDGNFYETLSAGTVVNGSELVGDTLFQITPQGARTAVYTLTSADGVGISNLIQDSQGNFYGVTSGGGQNDEGTIFKYNAQTGFSVLYSFTQENNAGINPGKLILASDGNLYGVTQGGGNGNSGTMYRLAPNGVYTTILSFSGSDGLGGGEDPTAIVQGSGRYFYVATAEGGQNQTGATFKVTVPVTDDLYGNAKSSLLTYGNGQLTTYSPISASAAAHAITQGYYPVAVGDFNGDGYADILWTSAKRDLYVWTGSATGFTPHYYGTYSAGWQVVGAADVNDDGNDDIILNNPSQHQISYQLMNNTTAAANTKTISYSAGYYPIAIGNFFGDGYASIAWTSAKNDLYIWHADAKGGFTSTFIANFPAGWSVAGRGDVDGDGVDDLVWTNSNHTQWGYWLLKGDGTVKQIYSAAVPAQLQGYHIATVADYNGDGRADILWTNGQNTMLMSSQAGACTGSGGCSFSTAASASVSAGLSIFNSGIPATVPAWAN